MRPNQLPTPVSGTRPDPTGHLPDIAAAIPWRTWEEGRDEARRRAMPMLVFAEPSWTNSAQRVALRLRQDDDLRDLVTSQVVPVLVDPAERPDLAAAWRWAAVALTGTAGPPLMAFLTHDGLPFLAYCTMAVEGDDTYPSLASLIESVAESYATGAAGIGKDARELVSRGQVPAAPSVSADGWERLRQRIDLRRGGLTEAPKHPHPMLLWSLLDAHHGGALPDDLADWLRATLDTLVRGGIWDQLDRGFHRCTRNDLWVVPHFEKPIPLNAQLAAVYARAAAELRDERYGDIGARIVSFCGAALREGVDAVGSDTGYYTWTSKELLNTLDPALVQVVTLHYDIKPVHERQALRRVVEMEQMDRFSHEDVDVLRTRLVRGRAQLRAARQRRPAPQVVSMSALSWRVETIRWLLEASVWTTVDVKQVVADLDDLIEGRFDGDGRGYVRSVGEGDSVLWLEDQAALLTAFLVARRVASNGTWQERAIGLADALLDHWWAGSGWLDHPGAAEPSRAIVDDMVPAPLGNLAGAFRELAELTGEQRHADQAVNALATVRSLGHASDHWSASVP